MVRKSNFDSSGSGWIRFGTEAGGLGVVLDDVTLNEKFLSDSFEELAREYCIIKNLSCCLQCRKILSSNSNVRRPLIVQNNSD